MNIVNILKEAAVTYYEALPQHLPGGTVENHDKPQTGYPVSGPIFEPGAPEYAAGVLSLGHNIW
jgi:hypothetical protein